jgi:hypothetical protein
MTIRHVRVVLLLCFFSAAAPPSAVRAADSGMPPAALRNLSLFAGLDGSKQPQDLGINANMGGRFAADMGLPLVPRAGLGLHLGLAADVSDAAVHVLDQIEGTSRRTQAYATVDVFQRTSARFTWALGYDFEHEWYYDHLQLGQVRGQAGYGVSKTNELGVWFAKSASGDDGVMGSTPVHLEPITQVNGYLRHTWPSFARTTVWAGFASGHDNVVWVLPPDSRNRDVFVYGADLHMPLSDRFAITGAANFLTPTATGTVDAHLGLTFYPGGAVLRAEPDAFAPVMTVANNPTFSVDLKR